MLSFREIPARLRTDIAWQAVSNFACWTALTTAAVWFWMQGWWPLTLVCWGIAGYFGHAILLAFHEASHGHLHRIRRANETSGNMIGLVILVPLSAYRLIHGAHHAHLAAAHDLELWPYVDPSTPRWFRRLSAVLELTIGFFYTPWLFFRGVWISDVTPSRKQRIWRDYAIGLLVWTTILSLVSWFRLWEIFLVGYLIPAMIGGNLQSLRKLTEHLGLLGNTPETAARTILPQSLVGRYMSQTMLNVTHHAAHHRNSGTRYDLLPAESWKAHEEGSDGSFVFPSFSSAFRDMLPALVEPRIGGQWLKNEAPQEASGEDHRESAPAVRAAAPRPAPLAASVAHPHTIAATPPWPSA